MQAKLALVKCELQAVTQGFVQNAAALRHELYVLALDFSKNRLREVPRPNRGNCLVRCLLMPQAREGCQRYLHTRHGP
jgi:hypothetical protein